ncbi:IclR family transcriptional regulator domain-containing protein [Pseudooceanicola aestuarii]|uniref:IclR family transcriptional regulator domain-containing protein n=1 Tax=Pseudooceanicola aestuarii TaxID=2697319 RepID=UPI0013CFDB8A|nr:IclR family transcriptional regulator C-terminal domain-containing protein [Pseudooceanicola aestuarii]
MLNKTDTIASFAKGLAVLECFTADAPRLAIKDVALATGLDRSTARRCLLTLTEQGYAEFDGKFFTLTPRVLRLGSGALASLPLPRIVQPWLDQMSDLLGQSCSSAILDEGEIVFVARAAQQRIMSTGLMVGSRLPAHCTAMGRVLLAGLPEEEARATVLAADLSPQTTYSLTDPEEILDRIATVRRDGYAFVNQEAAIGLWSLSVPVLNKQDRVVAAINTGFLATGQDPQPRIDICLPALRRVQTGLRRILA